MENNFQPEQPAPQVKQKGCSKVPILGMGLLAVAGVAFGVYGMFLQPKTKSNNPESTEKIETTNTNEKTTNSSAISTKKILSLLESKYDFGEFTTAACSAGAFGGALANDKFDIEEKIGFIAEKDGIELFDYDLSESCGQNCAQIPVSYDALNKKYHYYFPDESDLVKRDYNLSGKQVLFLQDDGVKYDEDKDVFYFQSYDAVGCRYSPMGYYNKVLNVEQMDDGQYVAKVLSVYADFNEEVSLQEVSEQYSDFTGLDIFKAQYDKVFSADVYDFSFVEDDGELKISDIKKAF